MAPSKTNEWVASESTVFRWFLTTCRASCVIETLLPCRFGCECCLGWLTGWLTYVNQAATVSYVTVI